MKKFRFFGLITAALICLAMCFAACDGADLGKHEHVWDDGEITTMPTCYKEGVRTYRCTVKGCEQTKTEPVQVTAHKWDDGTQTKAPKCNEAGETTFRCTNSGCTATKTEPIGKTDHEWDQGVITTLSDFDAKGQRTFTCQNCLTPRVEVLNAYADFVEQFGLDSWRYGTATDFDEETGDFTLASNGQTAVTASGVTVEGAVAVGYTFGQSLPDRCKAAFTVKFDGNVLAYVVLKAADGSVKEFKRLNEQVGAVNFDADVEKDALGVQKDDTLYLVLSGNARGALSFHLYAPCLHVWSSSVTKAPTCTDVGTKTFTCVNDGCEESFTEEMEATGHRWDGGVVTEEATEDKEGVRTFTCQDCGDTRTESIPKVEHIEYEDSANFAEDFAQTLAGNGNWQVGRVEYIWTQEDFTFTALTEKTAEAFTNGDPWMEVKGDWMANNGMVGLAYRFTKSVRARFEFTLNAVNSGKFSLRWALKGSDGAIKTNDGKASWGGDVSPNTISSELTVVAGDTLYILVNNESGPNDNQCTFSFVIQTPHSDTSEVTFDFSEDFAATLNGTSNWSVGIANYSWEGGESFTVTPITDKSDDAFVHSDPNFEIKRDSMTFNGMAALAYRFDDATTSSFRFALHGGENGEFAVRWALTDAEGNVKTNNGTPTWSGMARDVDIVAEVTAQANDVLYVLVNKEKEGDHCDFTFTVTAETKSDVEPEWNEESGFADEFQATLDGTSNWSVGTVQYDWGTENFTFAELTSADGAFKQDNPWVEIKGDWMAIQTMVGFAYKFDVTGTVHFDLRLRGVAADSAFTARWALKSADGTIKTNDGKASFVGNDRELNASEELEVAADDVLYILIQKEKDSDQCNFAITVTTEAVEYREIANFGNDFAQTLEGTSNWSVGTAQYDWGAENFTFTAFTEKSNDEFKQDNPWVEIKGDWMAIQTMVGLAYKFDVACAAHFDFHLLGRDAGSAFTARWALKSADGTIKTNGGNASFVGNDRELSASEDLEVAANDVLYIVIQKEKDPDQCDFSFVIEATQAAEPIQPKTSNFNDEFQATLDGTSNWSVGTVQYDWDAENFTFAALTEKTTDAFKNGDPWMEVKGDWMANNGMVGLAYTFDKAASAEFTFRLNFIDSSEFSVRWALKSADGTIKTNDGKASWGGEVSPITAESSFQVQAGDTLYVIVNHEGTADNQCNFDFTVTTR